MPDTLKVHDLFFSFQGESTRTGFPCIFIRLSGCNLRCNYCDTQEAWEKGDDLSIEDILKKVAEFDCKLVEVTGGEPMLQKETDHLTHELLEKGYEVMIETNGTVALNKLPQEVIKIVDMKCPDSESASSFYYGNLEVLDGKDEVKFVVSSRADFDWSVEEAKKHNLLTVCHSVSISPVNGKVEVDELCEWIKDSGMPLRLNLQLHKYANIP